jgi:predicted signal transduction protein with EAL and GGDEF domain
MAYMSLIRQLWLAIALVALVAFGGSALISSLSARAYLEDQLRLKNLDTANSLALTLSQMPKDEVAIELLIAAQFDTGHYERISLVDPEGRVIIERLSAVDADGAPAWFVALLPIEVSPGVAQVQDGWMQFGTLTLNSHARFAYRALWDGVLGLFGWFLAAAVLTGGVGSVLLRIILRPLDRVVQQAEAIGARRFVTIDEPATTEFRRVVRSMNALSRHVQQMLEEESRRLDQLRREAHHDSASGLFNRAHFLARVQAVLEREDERSHGVLVIARILDLQALNRVHGWGVMDVLISRFAESMATLAPPGVEWLFGRLNGSEFAVLAPIEGDAVALGRRLQETLRMLANELGLEGGGRMAAAGTLYRHDDRLPGLLARVDAALAAAVAGGGDGVEIVAGESTLLEARQLGDLAAWRARFDAALVPGQVRLQCYPVIDAAGGLLHEEGTARLRVSADAEWLAARQFLPWLARLGEVARLDEMVIELALDQLRSTAGDVCINLSAQSLNDAVLSRIATRLAAVPELAARLWIEVPEHGAYLHLEEFRLLCSRLQPIGCRVGIEHMGHQIARIGQLHDLGLDYVKVDAAFLHGLDSNPSNQIFLRGLAIIAHSIGLRVFAEGVDSEAVFQAVVALGFDGATGPAITARWQQDVPAG